MKVSTIIQKHWLPVVSLNGTIVGCSVVIAALSPKTATANSQFILPDTTANSNGSLGTLGEIKNQGIGFSQKLTSLPVIGSTLTSNEVVTQIWSSDAEKNKYPVFDNSHTLFNVKAVDPSTTIEVEAPGSLAKLAKQSSEKLLKNYQHSVHQLRRVTSTTKEQFSPTQLEEAEKKLELAKHKLAKLKKYLGLISSDEQAKNLQESLKSIKLQKQQISAQLIAAKIRTNLLSQRMGMTPTEAINYFNSSQNKEYQALQKKLSQIDTKIADEQKQLGVEHPSIKLLQEKRDQILTEIYKQRVEVVPNASGVDNSFGGNIKHTTMGLIAELIQADTETKALEREAKQLEKEVNNLQFQLSKISSQKAELLDLQRKYDLAEGVYKKIATQLEPTKISSLNPYGNFLLPSESQTNSQLISPQLSLMILGAILSLILGKASLRSFLESRKQQIKPDNNKQIELPILTQIPTFKSSTLGLSLESGTEIAFQELASNISLMSLENRRLMVSSCRAAEGKTTVTLGLAAALSFLGFRVLMVDGDFDYGRLSHYFGYFLAKDSTVLPTPVPINYRWDLLPAMQISNSRAIEFVASGGFKKHLDAIQQAGNYDYVIVDTPPLTSTSVGALMASAIANVLLVIQLGVSDRFRVQETVEQLMLHNGQMIGLALNGVDPVSQRYAYRHDDYEINS